MPDPVVSMAMLTIDVNKRNRDLLSRFEPIVLDRLYHYGHEVVSTVDLRDEISREYGLLIPSAALHTIARRAARRGLLVRENKILKFDRDNLEMYDLSGPRQSATREYAALADAGVQYAATHFDIEITTDDFTDSLLSYVERHTAPLLSSILNNQSLPNSGNSSQPSDLLVASFITHTRSASPAQFDYLANFAKGAVLASSLYFPDAAGMEARLNKLAVYLDTTILLRLVGACGPDLQQVSIDLVSLAKQGGARVLYFEHTLRELRGVLSSCEATIKRGSTRYYGEAAEFMVSSGWEVTDVQSLSDSIEDKLSGFSVELKDKPPPEAALTVDEDLLDITLQEHVGYSSRPARMKDLDSITSIYRLRRGRSAPSLSRTSAVFVTSNTALVRASRTFENLDLLDRGSVPLAMPDFVLTTYLWVSQEVAAPDLPTHSLVADCYAVMRADDHIWRLYLEKINSLQESGKVTENDYVLLRQSVQVRSLLMFETNSDPDAFTEGSVARVLERAKREIQEEALDRAEQVELELRAAKLKALVASKSAANDLRAATELSAKKDRETSRAVRKISRWVSVLILALTGIAAAVGAYYSLPYLGDRNAGGFLGFAVTCCVFLYAAVSLVSLLTGLSLPSAFQVLNRWTEKRVARAYRAISADPDRERPVG